jgi:hypothetical protein
MDEAVHVLRRVGVPGYTRLAQYLKSYSEPAGCARAISLLTIGSTITNPICCRAAKSFRSQHNCGPPSQTEGATIKLHVKKQHSLGSAQATEPTPSDRA